MRVRLKRVVAQSRRSIQNLSVIQRSKFTSELIVPLPFGPPPLKSVRVRFVRRVTYLREVPQEVVVRDRFRAIRWFLRRLRQGLSAIRDVFRFVYTPVVIPVYRFVQNLSVISDLFQRRVAYKRKQVEVVYVQVKAIIKKIKKWLAWLTKRMRLSIERPQHAEFKL